MPKICYNTRDEFTVIDLGQTLYFKADGNYSDIVSVGGQSMSLTVGLAKVEQMISKAYPKGTQSPFMRLGRSLIVNQQFLRKINILKQTIQLGDATHPPVTVSVPKSLVRSYKEAIQAYYSPKRKPTA